MCTVEADGEGRSGSATTRRGGDAGGFSARAWLDITLCCSAAEKTVDAGGMGSSGRATVLRGGEGVLEAGSSDTRICCSGKTDADRSAGMCVTMLPSEP